VARRRPQLLLPQPQLWKMQWWWKRSRRLLPLKPKPLLLKRLPLPKLLLLKRLLPLKPKHLLPKKHLLLKRLPPLKPKLLLLRRLPPLKPKLLPRKKHLKPTPLREKLMLTRRRKTESFNDTGKRGGEGFPFLFASCG
jgi:hypothetical protein